MRIAPVFAALFFCASAQLVAHINLNSDFIPYVAISVTNNFKKDMYYIPWNTPFDGTVFKGNAFTIINNGSYVDYIGPLAKRGSPLASDYKVFRANSTISAFVYLPNYYDISEGDYSLQLNCFLLDHSFDFSVIPRTLENFEAIQLVSNTVILKIKHKYTSNIVPHFISGIPTANPSFAKCSSTQQSTVQQGWDACGRMIAAASFAVNSNNGGQYYTTWFGSTSVFSKVTKVINAVNTNVQNGKAILNCGGSSCSAGVFAYVFPSDTQQNIYLCDAFWSAPVGGGQRFDTKGGTIIHELSHFRAVGATDDIQYGTTGCKNLAKNNPTKAAENADNYEFFCENQI